MTEGRLPITAIVVSRNEAHHLPDCLSTLRFCKQIIVVDLESTDGSATIAGRYADMVLPHPVSPIVEPVRCFAAQYATYDWLLFVDPDERYLPSLVPDMAHAVKCYPSAGIIELPMHYYFKRKRLTCTAWGKQTHYRPALVHRRRCRIRPLILRGFELLDGYERKQVAATSDNHILHYWMDSYGQLISKHARYVTQQGKAMYKTGKRFGLDLLIREPIVEFRRNLIERNGLKGGFRGIILSIVYSAFLAGSAVSLLAYQLRRQREDCDNEHTGAKPLRKAA